MAYIINVNRKTNSYTLRRTVRNITVNRVGKPGKTGKAATIQVGSTTTLPAGSTATVENTGTDSDAEFNFGIPQGAKGDPGDPATNLVTSVNGRDGAVTGLAEKAELDMVEEELYQDLTQGDAATLAAANQYTDEQFNVLTYVESVQAGTNVTVDNTDPKNPVVSATGTTSISFDNVTDKPLAPAFTGLLVNNASDEEFPTDQAEYSIQPDPLTFPFRDEQGNIKAAGAIENDDVVIKIQQDMLEEELFTDIQNGDAATLSSANTYTDTTAAGLQTQIDSKASNADLTAGLALKANFPLVNSSLPVRTAAGGQSSLPFSVNVVSGDIVRRDSGGQINGATPTLSGHVANKGYVDTSLGNYVLKSGDTSTGAQTVPQLNFTGGPRLLTGVGFPNGVVSAPVGSTYTDTAATNGAIEWKKATGTGNTGWVVSVGDTGWRDVTSLFSSDLTVVNPNDYGVRMRRFNNETHISIKAQLVNSTWSSSISLPFGMRVTGGGIPVVVTEFLGVQVAARISAQASSALTTTVNTGTSIGTRIFGSIVMPTAETWPTSLPGTAV